MSVIANLLILDKVENGGMFAARVGWAQAASRPKLCCLLLLLTAVLAFIYLKPIANFQVLAFWSK